jgi:hypothetical protein
VTVAIPNKADERSIGASVFVPVSPEELYETILDVRRFPEWASGVRRVEVLGRSGEVGMVSEWELYALGVRAWVRSVLEEAEAPRSLRWSYSGLLEGRGECRVRERGDGSLAEFSTSMRARDPRLEMLLRSSVVRSIARRHAKGSLSRLGSLVSGESSGVRVGPLAGLR